jgi:hypothetical protein
MREKGRVGLPAFFILVPAQIMYFYKYQKL